MSQSHTAVLRLVVAPAAVATFAGLELWPAGALVAFSGSWVVFTLCVIAISLWGKFQLEQACRRLQTRRDQRSRRTR